MSPQQAAIITEHFFSFCVLFHPVIGQSCMISDFLNKRQMLYYPEFVRLTSPDAGAYVWKPCIVNDVCKEFEGIVVWCDSGNILTNPNLLIQSAVTCGVYSGISSGSFLTWTHETARQHLPNSNRFLGNQMRNAACIAIDWSNPKARDLICEWKGYALRQEISLPPGASRSNHRHDQSILTYLIYSYQLPRIDHQTGYTIHNDID